MAKSKSEQLRELEQQIKKKQAKYNQLEAKEKLYLNRNNYKTKKAQNKLLYSYGKLFKELLTKNHIELKNDADAIQVEKYIQCGKFFVDLFKSVGVSLQHPENYKVIEKWMKKETFWFIEWKEYKNVSALDFIVYEIKSAGKR